MTAALGTVRARHVGTPAYDLSLGVAAPPWLQPGAPLACGLTNSELFFPLDYGLRNREQIEEAKGLCAACPVRALCLEWAVPQTDLDGIWAGTTPPERRRIRTGKPLPGERRSTAA